LDQNRGGKTKADKKEWKARDEITNSIGMRLAYIPPGKFLMGSSAEEIARLKKEAPSGYDPTCEGPQHKVDITMPFFMGVHEVTQKQYMEVMKTNPSYFSPKGGGKDKVKEEKDTGDFPVENVSWEDAVEFCRRLSELPEEKKAGRVYRLPTEAQWEYACRAGTKSAFHQGKALALKDANYNGEQLDGTKGPAKNRTDKVGSYQPNAWGLYDMHGNVAEWCRDGQRAYTVPDHEYVEDPRGPRADNIDHMLRGGAWNNPAWACRAAFRKKGPPSQAGSAYGFRVVCEEETGP
jgi:formylglycine-generating enzyme required for sulfatase activity